MTWQILIPHIPHRHDKLVELLDVLAAQMQPGVEVLIFTDNLEHSYAEKCQTLAGRFDRRLHLSPGQRRLGQPRLHPEGHGSARAVAGLRRVSGALHRGGGPAEARRPFAAVRRLVRRRGSAARPHVLQPDPSGLAQRVKFRGPYCDMEWADDLRALGVRQDGGLHRRGVALLPARPRRQLPHAREPFPEPLPEIPDYPFVRHLCLSR
jgi:hypothetical protein